MSYTGYGQDPDGELDMSGAKPVDAKLPVGEYITTIREAAWKASKSGVQGINVTFVDNASGAAIEKWYNVKDKEWGIRFFATLVSMAGLDHKAAGFKPSQLVGKNVKVVVAVQREKDGSPNQNGYLEVKDVFKPTAPSMLRGAVQTARTSTPEHFSTTDIDQRGNFKPGTPGPETRRTPPEHRGEQIDLGVGGTTLEDDLPF